MTNPNYQITIDEFLEARPKEAMGATVQDEDLPRLRAQALRVYRVMRDLSKWTLNQISASTGDPPASVSARIREIRAYLKSNGLGDVLRKPVSGAPGLFTYEIRLHRTSGKA